MGWLAVLIYSVIEIITWFRQRNVIALKISATGVWTEQTGLLNWKSASLKVYKWYDVVSITYDNPRDTHLLKWKLTDLSIGADELMKAKEMLRIN